MTNYRSYTPTEIEALADDLQQQLSEGILSDEILESFKFRGPEGKTWTVIPETGEWYVSAGRNWQPADPPDQPLDGSVEILDHVALSLSPLEYQPPDDSPPSQPGGGFLQMIEDAVRRVRDSYHSGRLNSGGAERLLQDLCLLDPAGLIWSYGIRSEQWYFFTEQDWELAEDQRPDPQDFETKPPDETLVCSSCGTSLNGGKFCSECGTPAPEPEPSYSQAAKEVVERFSKANADFLPEPVVPPWEPASGFPKVENAEGSQPAEPELSPTLAEWKLRIAEGEGAGETFPLGERTQVGRRKTNQIVLADEQCSLRHAEIQRQDDGYVITDQDSTNGTKVNGVRIESRTNLHPGDTITIGNTKMVVEEGEGYPETIIKDSQGAASTPGSDQPESSDSPPRKRTRNVVLVFVLVFAVTCLCCLSVGLGGYFLVDNQGLMAVFDAGVNSDDAFTASRDNKGIALTSLTDSPSPTELPSEKSDSSGPVMVLVTTGEFEISADVGVVSGEIQK